MDDLPGKLQHKVIAYSSIDKRIDQEDFNTTPGIMLRFGELKRNQMSEV